MNEITEEQREKEETREYRFWLLRCRREGYVDVPDWMPVGWPSHHWEYWCYGAVMMKPGPTLKDRLVWQLPAILFPCAARVRVRVKRWVRDTWGRYS